MRLDFKKIVYKASRDFKFVNPISPIIDFALYGIGGLFLHQFTITEMELFPPLISLSFAIILLLIMKFVITSKNLGVKLSGSIFFVGSLFTNNILIGIAFSYFAFGYFCSLIINFRNSEKYRRKK